MINGIIIQICIKIPVFYWIIMISFGYFTVRHGKSPFFRTVNHLCLWAIFHGELLVITRPGMFGDYNQRYVFRDPHGNPEGFSIRPEVLATE